MPLGVPSIVSAPEWRRYHRWDAGNLLLLVGYQAAGGIDGAVVQTAERVYAEPTAEQRQIVRDLFLLRLTALGEGTADTRRRLPRHEVAESA